MRDVVEGRDRDHGSTPSDDASDAVDRVIDRMQAHGIFGPAVFLAALATITVVQVLALDTPLSELHHRWAQWDSVHYGEIARSGWGPGAPASWLPGYPMLMAMARVLLHDEAMAGVVVTIVAGTTAAGLLGRLVVAKGYTPLQQRVVVITVLVWPFAFFLYGTVYPSALYLALALGAFVSVERGHTALPMLLVAAAALVRPEAVALFLGVLTAVVVRDRVVRLTGSPTGRRWRRPTIDRAALRPTHLWVLAALCGPALLAARSAAAFGSPLAYARSQGAVSQGGLPFSVRNLLSLDYVATLTGQGRGPSSAVFQTVGLLLLIVVVALTPAVARRVGPGYAVFSAASAVAVYVSLPDFVSTPRYLGSVFPVLVLAGLRLATAPRPVRVVTLVLSGTTMVLLHGLFSSSIGFPAW